MLFKRFYDNFQYDKNGNLLKAENNNTTVTFEYDIEGKLVKEKQGFDFVLENFYDVTGQRTKRVTKQRGKEKVVDYSFSPSGLPQAININGKEVVNLQYDRFGKLYKEKLGSLEKFYQYDNENRLSSQKLYGETGEIFKTEYNYDSRGNLQERKDSINGNDSYIYDPVGRIIRYTDPLRVTREMVKDPAGNYLQTKVVETEDSFKRVGDYKGVHYEFDKAGNLTQRDNLKLQWDSNNRLIQTEKEEQITRYKYDSFGRRISKETDGTETKFYWEGNTLISDTERDFHYYPYSFEPLIMEAEEQLYYYHNDLNGAPLRLTDQQGKVVWNAHYDVLGNIDKLSIKEVYNPIRMQGQYEDQETGLYYNRYRYFDANISAYISQDPIRLNAGTNLYFYGLNSVMWIDPLGLVCKVTGDVEEPSATQKKQEQLKENKAKGAKYEKEKFDEFSKNHTDTQQQVTIKAADGTRTRVDAIGYDKNGNLVIQEYKSSATAPLTANQKKAFPQIKESGGTVVGKGKGAFSGGFEIPAGTGVEEIRPEF